MRTTRRRSGSSSNSSPSLRYARYARCTRCARYARFARFARYARYVRYARCARYARYIRYAQDLVAKYSERLRNLQIEIKTLKKRQREYDQYGAVTSAGERLHWLVHRLLH